MTDRLLPANGVETRIRAMAKTGHSKTMTQELLGLSRWTFDQLVAQMPDVEFPGRNRSRGYRAAVERKRGVYTEAMRKASIAAGVAKHERAKRTVRGVTGTVDELVAHFECAVSPAQVRRRVRQGMTLEEALFTPKSTRNNLGRWLGVTADSRRAMLGQERAGAEIIKALRAVA